MKKTTKKGFSIIELIISLSIFIMLTGILMVNYNSMNKRMLLDTLVHQMAQWVRETQVSAMSVRAHVGDFKHGFGLHFETTALDDTKQFIYFSDLGGISANLRYDKSATLPCGDSAIECVEEVKLLPGNRIEKICGANPTPIYVGMCPSGFDQLDRVDIVFTRPNPDASILGDNDVTMSTNLRYGNVVIYVTSPLGYTRAVNVWTTGQVTVQ